MDFFSNLLNLNEKLDDDFDEKILESIRNFKPYRDEFVEFTKLICIYSHELQLVEIIFEFFEKAVCFLFPSSLNGPYYESWLDNFNFILRKLFVYLISILIKNKKYNWVNFFLKNKYYYFAGNEQKVSSFAVFEKFNRSLDDHRNKRLQLKRSSVTADLIKERADLSELQFQEIMQSDFILCVRYMMLDYKDSMNWYPRTLVYSSPHRAQPFNLFFKAQSKRHFEGVKLIFDIKSKDELITFFNKARGNRTLDDYRIGYHPIPFHTLLNLENLDKD